MPAFAYRPRTHCVCGDALAVTAATRTREYAWGPVTFRHCATCHSWCQSPEIEPASLAAWYDSDAYQGSAAHAGEFYANYLADEPARLREARTRARHDFAPLLPPRGGEVLEIGCATGSQLVALREAGHRVRGLDLSARFVAVARDQHGLDVAQRALEDTEFPAASFDLVLLLGTISNLSPLPQLLARIAAALKPGGHLVANFPAADSLTARLYGARYWMFAPTARTFLTTRGGTLALEQAGFSVRELRHDRQTPSWQKLVTHSRLPGAHGWISRVAARASWQPFSFPVPGIRLIVAQKPAT